MKKLLSLVAVLALAGCVQVPSNEYSGTIAGKPFKIVTPKNTTISNFDFTATSDGSVSLKVGSWSAVNDPNVIDKTAAGQAFILKTGLEGGAMLAGQMAAAMLKSQTNAPQPDHTNSVRMWAEPPQPAFEP